MRCGQCTAPNPQVWKGDQKPLEAGVVEDQVYLVWLNQFIPPSSSREKHFCIFWCFTRVSKKRFIATVSVRILPHSHSSSPLDTLTRTYWKFYALLLFLYRKGTRWAKCLDRATSTSFLFEVLLLLSSWLWLRSCRQISVQRGKEGNF